MKALPIARPGETLSVLCLGAHADDIEIGAGGTLLGWIDVGVELHVHWCVASAPEERAAEAEASALAFLEGAASRQIRLGPFEDSYFPHQGAQIKGWLTAIRDEVAPDVVFTHRAHDAHQDHRTIQEITWNLFRDHLVLEYEIPKWDGDVDRPNVYLPLTESVLARKIALLDAHFGSQRSKDWFDADTFRGLARLRGMECRATERFAEAFCLRKMVLA